MSVSLKSVSFHRWYHGYTGGHQKVRDYLQHTLAVENFQVNLWLENKAKIKADLFEQIPEVNYQPHYNPIGADIVFLAGLDWNAYLPLMQSSQVKLNLIQHIRHGDPNHPLHAFLQHRAIRLCVSEAVRQAILPYANGPCFTIKMGHDIPVIKANKVRDLYILAPKQPQLGHAIADWAKKQGLSFLLDDVAVERESVYQNMASSRISIPLPNKTEGFFLPGIEAMALSDWGIVPDCIASREYSKRGANISVCDLDLSSCCDAIDDAMRKLSRWSGAYYRHRGKKRAQNYSLSKERMKYQQILTNVSQIW